MCNCIKEIREKIKELTGSETVLAPIELITGRLYITFDVERIKPNGRNKFEKFHSTLPCCPFCGVKYDEKPEGGE